ncbi:MAG: FliH/SctL family protein, partial [Limisphaerales bacterium]
FGAGPVPLDMSVRKDVPFWESIEAHYRSIREKAIADARKKALQEAKDAFEVEHRALFDQVNSLVGNLEEAIPKAFREMEEALTHMACTLTKKLMANIPVNAERIRAVVSEAIGELEREAALQVRIHPEDLALLSEGTQGNNPAIQFNRGDHLRFTPDENLTRGGCYIKTPFGDFDATMESKWARVVAAFQRRPQTPAKTLEASQKVSETQQDPAS